MGKISGTLKIYFNKKNKTYFLVCAVGTLVLLGGGF